MGKLPLTFSYIRCTVSAVPRSSKPFQLAVYGQRGEPKLLGNPHKRGETKGAARRTTRVAQLSDRVKTDVQTVSPAN